MHAKLFAVFVLTTLFHPAHAQGVPVIDQSAILAAQQNLQTLQQQLQQLNGLLQTAQNLTKSIGQAGNPSMVFQQNLTQSGLNQFSAMMTTALGAGGVSSGSGLQAVLSQLSRLPGAPAQSTPDFSNFNSTQQWVTSALTTPSNSSATVTALGRQARAMVAGESAADGYALALTARQQVSAMANRAQTLTTQVNSATSLRDDVAANTAVMLAIHDEMAEIQALFAALLAVQSSDQLVAGDMTATTSATGQ
jgi:hypothetical protein